MKQKVILLTGLSGSGKTTLANELKQKISPIKVIGIGKYILEIKQAQESKLKYNDLYHNPTKVIRDIDMKTVYQKLIEDSNKLVENNNVILEGHAVTMDHYGFFVKPASHELLTQIPFSAIIMLQLTPQTLLNRMNSAQKIKKLPDLFEISCLNSLQYSTAINYSSTSNCPLYVINETDNLEELVKHILEIFDAIEMPYNVL